jgi:predicted PurR-regulated permease PerM
LALTISPWKVVYVIIGFIVIHQLEGTVIAPKVVGESVGLHPLIVIFSLLVGGDVGGLMGLLLAVPITAVAKVAVQHVFRRLTETGLPLRLRHHRS